MFFIRLYSALFNLTFALCRLQPAAAAVTSTSKLFLYSHISSASERVETVIIDAEICTVSKEGKTNKLHAFVGSPDGSAQCLDEATQQQLKYNVDAILSMYHSRNTTQQ